MQQYIECEKSLCLKEHIVKHFKNIIDLIEEGDYVNGYEVLDKYLFNGEMPVLETKGYWIRRWGGLAYENGIRRNYKIY